MKKTDTAKAGKISIIKTGGKQYVVASGDILAIEKLAGEHKVGDKVVFDEVFLTADGDNVSVGTPNVSEKVTGEIVEIGRAAKVDVIKYKQKSRYFKKNGHRQPFFKVKIA